VFECRFSAAALSGADALEARTEWIVDRVDLKSLEQVMKKKAQSGDIIVMEAGGNSFAIAERLFTIGLHPIVLESQAIGKVGKAYCATDKIDAVKIARVYFSGLAHEVWMPFNRPRRADGASRLRSPKMSPAILKYSK